MRFALVVIVVSAFVGLALVASYLDDMQPEPISRTADHRRAVWIPFREVGDSLTTHWFSSNIFINHECHQMGFRGDGVVVWRKCSITEVK